MTASSPFPEPLDDKAARGETRSIEGLALKILREWAGWKQDRLAAAVSTHPGMVVRWEKRVPRDKLLLCAAAMGYELAEVDALLYGLRRALLRKPSESWSPVGPTPEERWRIRRFAAHLLHLAVERIETLLTRRLRSRRATKERRKAQAFWKESLLPTKPEDRRLLMEADPACQTWALAELLAHESERAAADDAGAALQLAQLAVRTTELATASAPEAWRRRLLGYVWLFTANALRVGPGFNDAEAASAKGWELWVQGADPAGLLAEWRLADLTASLRRDQRRFEEALALHDRARELAPQAQVGRILLKKATTYVHVTDYVAALATLDEAAPRIAATGEPRLLWAHLVNRVNALCYLGRHEETTASLAEARRLAHELGNALDKVRLRWIEGRISQRSGDSAGAQAAFEQVRQEFDRLRLPYDFALASLDLALLRREQGRWRHVRALAAEMVKTFEEHHVHREAVAAVLLFQEAAAKEAVTVELVCRLRSALETARRQPANLVEP